MIFFELCVFKCYEIKITLKCTEPWIFQMLAIVIEVIEYLDDVTWFKLQAFSHSYVLSCLAMLETC